MVPVPLSVAPLARQVDGAESGRGIERFVDGERARVDGGGAGVGLSVGKGFDARACLGHADDAAAIHDLAAIRGIEVGAADGDVTAPATLLRTVPLPVRAPMAAAKPCRSSVPATRTSEVVGIAAASPSCRVPALMPVEPE